MKTARRRLSAVLCLSVAFAAGVARAEDAHGHGDAGHGDAGHGDSAHGDSGHGHGAAPVHVDPVLRSDPPPMREGDLPDLVRNLNAAQNRVVVGDAASRSASLKRFELVERALQDMTPDDWAQQRNVRAAATYLLCGGSARTLRKIFNDHGFHDEDAALIGGSVAYAEGRRQDALTLLAPLDPRHFSETLGGHLALVVGGLLLGDDNERAKKMFDLARLLLPGSIVEEAALRRQILIVDAAVDPEKATLLLRRYIARYLKSPYSRNFWDDLTATTFRMSSKLPPEKFSWFEDLFSAAPPAKNFELHLGLARVALLTGKMDRARAYIDKSAPLADTPAAHGRVDLYEGAYKAISGEFSEGLAAMLKIDSNTLPPHDVQMQKIVSASVMRLQASDQEPAPPGPTSAREAPQVVLAAQEALEQSDLVLKKAMRE